MTLRLRCCHFATAPFGAGAAESGILRRGLTMRSLILTFLLAAAASAQTHPNFTGAWKQDDSRSTVRPGSTLKYSNKIDHQDPKLSKTTIMDYGDRQPNPYTQTYTTDGTPVKSSDREGDQITTTVKWEGNTLVF